METPLSVTGHQLYYPYVYSVRKLEVNTVSTRRYFSQQILQVLHNTCVN